MQLPDVCTSDPAFQLRLRSSAVRAAHAVGPLACEQVRIEFQPGQHAECRLTTCSRDTSRTRQLGRFQRNCNYVLRLQLTTPRAQRGTTRQHDQYSVSTTCGNTQVGSWDCTPIAQFESLSLNPSRRRWSSPVHHTHTHTHPSPRGRRKAKPSCTGKRYA